MVTLFNGFMILFCHYHINSAISMGYLRALLLSLVKLNTVKLQWLEHLWNHKNMFETGVVRANEFNHCARSGGIISISFTFSST